MNLNKCERCGCFFASTNCVCPKCLSKDETEISQLQNFLSENDDTISIDELAYSTGVSLKNVNRFLKNEEVNSKFLNLGLTTSNLNKNINLC